LLRRKSSIGMGRRGSVIRGRRKSIVSSSLTSSGRMSFIMSADESYGKKALRSCIELTILREYNNVTKRPLIMENTVENIASLIRLLTLSFGHALLCGRRGSGKRSAARLAGILASHEVIAIKNSTFVRTDLIFKSPFVNAIRGLNWRDCIRDAIFNAIEGV
ncbi:hypothetical protein TrCOL_g8215, partial [Triparma columacea]